MLSNLCIYYDDVQEGDWFRGLHSDLATAELVSLNNGIKLNPKLAGVLRYDRPDIVLAHHGHPILAVERTIEVPSGHNVGQRFARLAAAAESGVPSVFFGPYVAFKHGGETQGPRYMNLRFFRAIDALSKLTGSAVTTINWPVDTFCEVRRDPGKDDNIREYMSLFLSEYPRYGLPAANPVLMRSPFQSKMVAERERFSLERVRRPERYEQPPPSAEILAADVVRSQFGLAHGLDQFRELVVYTIGSKTLRADPYAGTGILYHYLYVRGEPENRRGMILRMPQITVETWLGAAASETARKEIRLYRLVADGILFADKYLPKDQL